MASNRELVERFIEVVWNQQRTDRIGEFVAPDYAVPLLGSPEPVRGTDVIVRGVRAFHGWRDTIDDIFADDDRVVVRWTAGGTHAGPFAGVAATNRSATLTGIDIFRLEGGRIAEHGSQADMAGFVNRLRAADKGT